MRWHGALTHWGSEVPVFRGVSEHKLGKVKFIQWKYWIGPKDVPLFFMLTSHSRLQIRDGGANLVWCLWLRFGTRGLVEGFCFFFYIKKQKPFLEILETLEILDNPSLWKTKEKQLFSRDSKDSRDSSSEVTPFVTTPFSGPDWLVSVRDYLQ